MRVHLQHQRSKSKVYADRGDLRILQRSQTFNSRTDIMEYGICFDSPEIYDAEGLLFNNRFVAAFYHFIDAVRRTKY